MSHRVTGLTAQALADLSEQPNKSEDLVLIVDVGTNAEILLGNTERVLACSSPTGPAFEGAQISSGQRAAPGAIERVEIDPISKEPRFKVIGSELWSDEIGFEEIRRSPTSSTDKRSQLSHAALFWVAL